MINGNGSNSGALVEVRHRFVDDHRMILGIGRIELCNLFGRECFEQNRRAEFVIHVLAQIPCQRLCPGQRVERCPRVRFCNQGSII